MIEEALFAELKAHDGIADKVEDGSAFHIYPLRFPEGTALTNGYALTYSEISQTLIHPLARRALFQITAFADTFQKARALAADVDDCLNDLSSVKLGGLFPITYCKFEGRQALFDETTNLWQIAAEYSIKF